jgi:3-hydroxyacyl-CoA dehydrogenase
MNDMQDINAIENTVSDQCISADCVSPDIQTVVVIGAGAMGSGIAAQAANAGCFVYLLDIVPSEVSGEGINRNLLAEQAIQRMLKATPATDPLNAGFMHPDNAQRIIAGNLDDHFDEAVQKADWVVEAIVENLEIKRALFERLEKAVKPSAILSSNTSTIPLKDLVAGRSTDFQKQFVITHFFNPPRFMRLLEVVSGTKTDPKVTRRISIFGDQSLGKEVIQCKDTPAFLANRIGIYYMFRAIVEAIERQINVEDVDAVLGTPIGFPKEGIFGLLDLVGIGIIPLVTKSLQKTLPTNDPFRLLNHQKGLNLVEALLRDGRTGRKAEKGGFYRRQKDKNGQSIKQVVSLYNPSNYYTLPNAKEKTKGEKPKTGNKTVEQLVRQSRKHGPRAMFEDRSPVSRFAWVVVRDTLLYAAHLIPEISGDIADIDVAMRGGYNARWGPFQIIDKLGVEWFCQKVAEDGIQLPLVLKMAGKRSFYKGINGQLHRLFFNFETRTADYIQLKDSTETISLSTIKRTSKPLISHGSASLWNIGDGVACLEFHSKMNTLDPSVLYVMNESIGFIQTHRDYKAMVIYNEGKQFSLGANLGLVEAGLQLSRQPAIKKLALTSPLQQQVFDVVERLVFQGQSVFSALKHAPFPVVGAPQGMALGGGCEVLLHCHAIQASAETYMGLVESGVGLIPAWGGCVRFTERMQQSGQTVQGPMAITRKVFEALLMPQNAVSTSAQDALKKCWLRPGVDQISMNPDRVLADAKALALNLLASTNYSRQAHSPYNPTEALNTPRFRLAGKSGHAALNMALDDFYSRQLATDHDVVVADALADTLTGGECASVGVPVSEQDMLRLERENFLSLLHTAQTQKRVSHILKTGKPLRESFTEAPEPVEAVRKRRKPVAIKPREITGLPLAGQDAMALKVMADAAILLLRASGVQ